MRTPGLTQPRPDLATYSGRAIPPSEGCPSVGVRNITTSLGRFVPHVVGLGPLEKMSEPPARRIVAPMEYFFPWKKRTESFLPDESVDENLLAFVTSVVDTDKAVALLAPASMPPKQAWGFQRSWPESHLLYYRGDVDAN